MQNSLKVILTVSLICSILFALSGQAESKTEAQHNAWNSTTDSAPHVGPVIGAGSQDPMWDLLFDTNAQQTTGDNQLLGAEFGTEYFYITGGNSAGEPNQVYVLNSDGTLNFQFDQWSSAGWGWRDLAFDGDYLYGSDDYIIDAFDLEGNPVPEMNITGPINPCRGLAYDPITDHFWTASFSSALYEFDRDGNVIWSGPTGLTGIYGLAWDDVAPDGPWLWIYDQSGTPATTFYQCDPNTGFMTGLSYTVPLLSTSTDQMAGGAFITSDWDPWRIVIGGITQGTPDDLLFVLELYEIFWAPVPAAPTNLATAPDPAGGLTCEITWDLPTTTVSGEPIYLYPITSVEVERNGVPIATLPPDATSHSDTVPAAGPYVYEVYCVNSYGIGVPASVGTWIGLDTPGEVDNLVAEPQGFMLECLLTWDNPTVGAHGGYFPTGAIDGYIINRYGPVPATFDITGLTTQFLDTTIPTQGWYYYGVSATNSSGTGPEVFTPEMQYGPAEFEEIPYDWIEINPAHPGALPGTNTGITLDDQNVGPFPIGFTFPWYGIYSFSSIRVCSNGFLSFTSTATSFTNYPIPTQDEPNNLIAPYWDDMNIGTSYYGSIWYYADPGGDFFVVEYDSCNHYGSSITGDYFTFEAILYPNGEVDFQYKAIEPGTLTPFPSATVGIENAEGTVGVQVTYDGSGPWEPASQTAVKIFGQITPPPFELMLTPYDPPINIQATGGSFDFNIYCENYEAIPFLIDLWIMTQLPNGQWYGPLLGPVSVMFPPGGIIERDRSQYVPVNAPPGEYLYEGRCGVYPDLIYYCDSFTFEKLTDGDGPVVAEWKNTGDSFDLGPLGFDVEVPLTFNVQPAYPNPFNPSTTLSFTIPEASKVQLNVYDISGSLVATVIDGWREPGQHEAVVDAVSWSSGIYLYRLEAGKNIASGKIVLVK